MSSAITGEIGISFEEAQVKNSEKIVDILGDLCYDISRVIADDKGYSDK